MTFTQRVLAAAVVAGAALAVPGAAHADEGRGPGLGDKVGQLGQKIGDEADRNFRHGDSAKSGDAAEGKIERRSSDNPGAILGPPAANKGNS